MLSSPAAREGVGIEHADSLGSPRALTEHGLDDLEGVEQAVGAAAVEEFRPVDRVVALRFDHLKLKDALVEVLVRREHLNQLPGLLCDLPVLSVQQLHE
jgi:hypothetical protein